MKYRAFSYLFVILVTLISSTLYSLVIIRADNPNFPYNFVSGEVSATVLQPSTGTLFVGLNDLSSSSNSTFSIAKAYRPTFTAQPRFVGIATNANVQGEPIEFLTVSNQLNRNALVPFVIQSTSPFSATQVSAIFDNGDGFNQSIPLQDAAGDTTAGIVQLATTTAQPTTSLPRSMSNVFAAVRPTDGNFGDPNSGIALMSLTSTSTTTMLSTLNAQTGRAGNMAAQLDENSEQLAGNSLGDAVEFSTTPTDVNQVAFYYDNTFKRLYIGVRIATGSMASDIGKSVVVGQVDNQALILEPIAPDSALDTTGNLNQIVVAQNATDEANVSLRANHISVMHTSAGPSYLIVQGGLGKTEETGNSIFALPLVDNASDPATQGTLADASQQLTHFKFTEPATTPDELVTAQDPAAQVGNGLLPILPTDQISDMQVVGDAVFVSIPLQASIFNDTGILYSQALFAADGKVIGWTPWTQRASPINLFPNVQPALGSGVQFFNVDAATGNIYMVPAPDSSETPALVGVTSWTDFISTDTTSTTALIDALNHALPEGSYSVLDLPQSVRGFTDVGAPLSRYALFGGVNKVALARISEATTQAPDSAQEVITDFSDPANFFVKQLPTGAGYVQALEYSRQTAAEGDTNYFFAGTQNGLFAFANGDGEGFNVINLSTLDQAPLHTGFWQKVPEISGSIVDIKSSGLALYILTFETTEDTPLKSTLYAVSFAPTLAEMFSPATMNIRTLAQTQTDPVFDNTHLFTGIQIIATGDPATGQDAADKEQLILATNQGLYKSNANQANDNEGIADADNQIEAGWELIDTTETTMYTGISGIETPIRHTTWPISVQDRFMCKTFDASSIDQLNGNGDPTESDTGVVGFAPLFFNANTETPAFETLDPITYFFSDGGRRFFIINSTSTSSTRTQLSVIPFNTQIWHVTSPQKLTYQPLRAVDRFFWVRTIGMSGIVLAGTNQGVIGLT